MEKLPLKHDPTEIDRDQNSAKNIASASHWRVQTGAAQEKSQD